MLLFKTDVSAGWSGEAEERLADSSFEKMILFFEQTSWCSHVDVSQHIFDMKNWSGNHVWGKKWWWAKRRERERERERNFWKKCTFVIQPLLAILKRVIYKKNIFAAFFCQNREKLVTLSVSSSDVKAVTRWSGGRQADEFIDRVTRCRITAPFWRFCESPWWLLFFLLALMTSRGTTVPGAGSLPESRLESKFKVEMREKKNDWLKNGYLSTFR